MNPSSTPDFYQELLAHTVDVVTVLDEDGTVRYHNQAVERMLGYDPEALVGDSVFEHIHPDDRERVAEAFDELVTGAPSDAVTTAEFRFERADGSWLWMEARAVDQTDTDIDGYTVTARDISERKMAEEERRAIIDRMGDAFFAVDLDWNLQYVNAAAREILGGAMGRDPDETFQGLNLWEEIPEAVDTVFHERYQEAMSTQEPVEFEEYYPDMDAWFDVRAFPSETGLSVYFRDVTEERRQREMLEARKQVLQDIHGIIADPDRSFTGKIEALLQRARTNLGMDYGTLSRIDGDEYVFEIVDAVDDRVTAGDVVPVSATNCELVATQERTVALGDIARDAPEETDRAGYTEMGIRCYLGAPVLVGDEVYGTFCFYDTEPRQGQFSDWEVTLVNILGQWASYELERTRTHERLAAQNERLDKFTSIVSHDLRNPLNVLGGSLDLAAETGDEEHFDRCRRAVSRMETLVEDMLELARAGSSIDVDSLEPVSLETLSRGCWEQVATTDTDATLDVTATGRIRADETRLRQLLENLLRNAIEHGGSGVTVRIGDLEDGFFVADDGPGVPAEDREAVFEAGYSTQDDGTGFGLSIVQEIANAHGWTITLTDSEGGGARFEITGVDRPAA